MTTYRVKHSRSTPYARLNKKFLESPNLSAKAKGILAYLLSRPDDWRICINQLVKVFTDGESAIRSGLAELKEAGYLTKAAVRDRYGRIISWVTDVYEVPQTFRRQTDKNGNLILHNLGNCSDAKHDGDNSRDGENPHLENLQVDKPDVEELDVEKPDLENRRQLINEDQLTNELTNSPLTPQGERENSELKNPNWEHNPTASVEPLDSTDSFVNSPHPVEDKSSAVPGEIVKKYDRALGIRPPVDWASCQQRHFDWVSGGPWLVDGKLDPNFVTWQALDWQKAYGGDLHKKRADVLRHFKKDPANLVIAWEHYSNEQHSRYENAAVRMHNGLEIQPDEQQRLIQHARAVTEPLPEEINPVATEIHPVSVLSAVSAPLRQEALPSGTEPVKVFEKSSGFHLVENGEIGQHEPETVFNHFGTLETTQGEHWRGDLANPCSTHPCMSKPQSKATHSVPTDSSGMTENSDAYQEWKPKPIEGEPVTPEQFRAKLGELSRRLSMPIQQEQPRVSETSEIEELNNWLADPLLRKEVMPRVMKSDRYTIKFNEDGDPLRVVEVKP